MKLIILLVLVSVCSISAIAQEGGKPPFIRNRMGPEAMCNAAMPKLRDAHTNQVVLTMVVDGQGRVDSFKTEAPKGLRLEKMKKAATEIKAMRFEPAMKDGRPVVVMIRAVFECSMPAPEGSKQ